MPRGEVFSIFYKYQKQVRSLFKVLYYAKNWDVFYKTACWAREYVNEGMYIYATHAAIRHRNDTKGMVLPPIYEIYPFMFAHSGVIKQAIRYKLIYGDVKNQNRTYYANDTYSGWNVNTHRIKPDMKYFYEDVGFNSWYYYLNLDNPFWLGGEEFGLFKDRRGELYYRAHHGLLTRYYLARLSNGKGAIEVFDWEKPIKTGYEPDMIYQNGVAFQIRPANSLFENKFFEIQKIKDYERRIREAIDSGYIFTDKKHVISIYNKDGIDYLGKVIEGSVDSPNRRYYGALQVLAPQILGYAPHLQTDYKIVPSAMENFETCLRDPVFYQFYNRLDNYFLQYKNNLPYYNNTDLEYPGVKIKDVQFDKLVTYFEQFEWDITNALYFSEKEFKENNYEILTRQWRLNHKPFTYKMYITSDKDHDVKVRVFIGPKYNENGYLLSIKDNWMNFAEFDMYPLHLKTGENIITRHSNESLLYGKDRTTWRQLYNHVNAALQGKKEFYSDFNEAYNNFPDHLFLPRGTVDGQDFQIFFHIGPLTAENIQDDDLPIGFPMDRPVANENILFVPNSWMEDVKIYHETKPKN